MREGASATWGGDLVRRIPPRMLDALFALVVAAVTAAMMVAFASPWLTRLGFDLSPPRLTIALVLPVVQCLPLVLWRVRPQLAFVLVEVCQLGVIAAAPQAQLHGIATMFAAFGLGAWLPTRPATVLVGAAVVAETVTAGVATATLGEDVLAHATGALLTASSMLLLPMAVGVAVRSRIHAARLLRERAQREHERQVDDAITEERRRIAGELHDVAAHHLSGMVVQAAAIERMIDRDPDAAKAAASQLRLQGKQTLNGLRKVVGLLRADGEIAAVPGLRDLPELVDATRELGMDADFLSTGEIPELAPIVDAAVYRITQQAITNAVQHAPGAFVRVEQTTTPEELTMQIVNGPARQHDARTGARRGTGLAVMRERAALIGARLEAGPVRGGGWRVAFALPLSPASGGQR